MNYSIIKVEGLSMKPFLKTSDYILVKQLETDQKIIPGICIYQNKLVHRCLDNHHIKGDRLLYQDPFPLDFHSSAIVIGRIIKKFPKLTISNYQHPILLFFSKKISIFSQYNTEKNPLRILVLISIISLASTHRFLEFFFHIPENLRESK